MAKSILFLSLVLLIPAISEEKKDKYECRSWKWTGDVYERKVVCIEWRKKENFNLLKI